MVITQNEYGILVITRDRKFWQAIQVKAIGKENLANKLQSVHTYVKYIFGILVRKILVELKFSCVQVYYAAVNR